MRLQATFSFFIFLQLFHFFTLLLAPSSSSLLPPHIHKYITCWSQFVMYVRIYVCMNTQVFGGHAYFDGHKSIQAGRRAKAFPTDGSTDTLSYKVASLRLEII